MTKSMTAYGRGSSDTPEGRFVVELHSVNRKGLEIHVYLPRDCTFLDMPMRKWMAPLAQRGQVTIRVFLHREDPSLLAKSILPKLKALQSSWSEVAGQLGMNPEEEIDLPFLIERMSTQAAFEQGEEAGLQKGVKAAFDLAADAWAKMREEEGIALAKDVAGRIDQLETFLADIEKQSPHAVEEYHKKLKARLQEISQDIAANEERVLREAALMAEKTDVSEEITRLHSHFAQMKKLLASSEKGMGRTMEFLVQEMLREINTLGSKSVDLAISKQVVPMKGELEKIREQVMNIE